MRVVIQRVTAARVEVAGEIVGAVEQGLCVFAGMASGDTDKDLELVARKVVELRVFEDERGKMAKSLADVGGKLLVVSQFTLFGDISRGNRPGFSAAMAPDEARAACDRFVDMLRARGAPVETGRFGADMRVLVDNDGPVTILFDSRSP